MSLKFNTSHPPIEDLRKKAAKKVLKFAMEYLEGGCDEHVTLYKNTSELREVELTPYHLRPYQNIDLKTEMFGHVTDAPFGIAPVGLQGLMWPNAPEILAKAAHHCERKVATSGLLFENLVATSDGAIMLRKNK